VKAIGKILNVLAVVAQFINAEVVVQWSLIKMLVPYVESVAIDELTLFDILVVDKGVVGGNIHFRFAFFGTWCVVP